MARGRPNPARAAKIAARNAAVAVKLKERIAKELKAGANKGAEAAIRFLAARTRETLNVPAPKRIVRDAQGGILYHVATTPAIKGAPPRKLSGRMQKSVKTMMLTPFVAVMGLSARADKVRGSNDEDGFNYPKFHELGKDERWGGGKHQFIRPTVIKWRKELERILGAAVRMVLKTKKGYG